MWRWVRERAWGLVAKCPIVLVVGGVSLALVASIFSATHLRLDLSFRPLFSDAPALQERSASFERDFGALGSDKVGVLVSAQNVLADDVLLAVGRLSTAMAQDSSFSAVVSPLALPLFTGKDSAVNACPSVDTTEQAGACRKTIVSLERRAPELVSSVVASDKSALVVWATVDGDVFDLASRRKSIERLQVTATEAFNGTNARARLVGYSVVEVAYEGLLLRGAAIAAAATFSLIALLLLLFFRSWRAAATSLVGVCVALPMSLAAMAAIDLPVTLVSAAIPTLLLMIGVADSVHVVRAILVERESISDPRLAIKRAWTSMLWPCVLTTFTTAVGFGTLVLSSMPLVRDFGVAVALGVVIVHFTNAFVGGAVAIVLCPARRATSKATPSRWSTRVASFVVRRARLLSALGLAAMTAATFLAVHVELIQPFNRDIHASHPIRAAQQELEAKFSGFLGPDLVVERRDGRPLQTEDDLVQLHRLARMLERDDDVTRVFAVTDAVALIPSEGPLPTMLWPMVLEELATERAQRPVVDEALSLRSADRRRALLAIRTGDIGTKRAEALLERVHARTEESLGPEYTFAVGGRWTQAQMGMAALVADLFQSFLIALLLVIPVLVVAANDWRLALVATLPNIAPLVVVIGAMVALDLPLRIGTAVVCAVALGIAVDDTLHILCGFGRHQRSGGGPTEKLASVYRETGAAMAVTSVVLAAGFLSLSLGGLQVLTDMGRLGAIVMVAALFFDGVWLPALWVWGWKIGALRDARVSIAAPIGHLPDV